MDAVETFTERAQQAGITVEVEEFPEGTETASDAAAAIGCDVTQIVKSVVVVVTGWERDHVAVVLTAGDHRVDTDTLAAELDADQVTLASPDIVRNTTGYVVGGVPPVGHDRPIPTFFDTTLADFDTVWAAAGSPETVFPVDPAELRRVTDATAVETFD